MTNDKGKLTVSPRFRKRTADSAHYVGCGRKLRRRPRYVQAGRIVVAKPDLAGDSADDGD
jgi:hypothetical protein